MISSLAYFGVLNPKRMAEQYAPERCIMEAGLGCVDHSVEYLPPVSFPPAPARNKISLVVLNNIGYTIILDQIEFPNYGTTYGPLNIQLFNDYMTDEDAPFEVSGFTGGDIFKPGDTYDIDFEITVLNDESELIHKYSGSIRGKVA